MCGIFVVSLHPLLRYNPHQGNLYNGVPKETCKAFRMGKAEAKLRPMSSGDIC